MTDPDFVGDQAEFPAPFDDGTVGVTTVPAGELLVPRRTESGGTGARWNHRG